MVLVLRSVRALLLPIALFACAAFSAGCDTGGLLIGDPKGPEKPPQNQNVNEMVSGGTFASNSKYRIFYSNGQGTPNQGVSSSTKSRLNGGIVGAAQ